ncbi:hypothetical protein [Streptomyces sp. WG7]|uniref:hypothetical protein n=1 Tax=Streptomyces sp. WG7 TaxID=3417650 RepID=UPI003CF37CA9
MTHETPRDQQLDEEISLESDSFCVPELGPVVHLQISDEGTGDFDEPWSESEEDDFKEFFATPTPYEESQEERNRRLDLIIREGSELRRIIEAEKPSRIVTEAESATSRLSGGRGIARPRSADRQSTVSPAGKFNSGASVSIKLSGVRRSRKRSSGLTVSNVVASSAVSMATAFATGILSGAMELSAVLLPTVVIALATMVGMTTLLDHAGLGRTDGRPIGFQTVKDNRGEQEDRVL